MCKSKHEIMLCKSLKVKKTVWRKGDTHKIVWWASAHWPRSLIILSVLRSDHRLHIPAKHLLRLSVLPDLVREEMWHDICNRIYKSSWSHRLAVNLKTVLSLPSFKPFIQSTVCVCPLYSARLTQKKTHSLSACNFYKVKTIQVNFQQHCVVIQARINILCYTSLFIMCNSK